MVKTKTIYLAGAINGCSDAQCKDWREYVKTQLGEKYEYLDPMRRDYRGKEAESVDLIIHGDKEDIMSSDIFLANANDPSWGTGMEIFFAYNRPSWGFGIQPMEVVLVCNKERPSPWLVGHSHKIFKTLDEAIKYLEKGI